MLILRTIRQSRTDQYVGRFLPTHLSIARFDSGQLISDASAVAFAPASACTASGGFSSVHRERFVVGRAAGAQRPLGACCLLALPCHICTGTGAHPSHICTGTGRTSSVPTRWCHLRFLAPRSYAKPDMQINGILNGAKRVWSQRNGEVGWFMLGDLVSAIGLMADELRARS